MEFQYDGFTLGFQGLGEQAELTPQGIKGPYRHI